MNGTADVPERTVTQCMAHLDEITTMYVDFLERRAPAVFSILQASEIDSRARASLEVILRYCGRLEITDRLASFPRTWGQFQAQHAVPVDLVERMNRLYEHVVWRALIKYSDPDAQRELADSTLSVWQACERYALGVIHAFQRERAREAQRQPLELDGYVRALFSTGGASPTAVSDAAMALATTAGGVWVVAVSEFESESDLQKVKHRLAPSRVPAHLIDLNGFSTLLVKPVSESSVRSHLDDARCAFMMADHLRHVPRAQLVAQAMLSAAPKSTAKGLHPENGWEHLAVDALGPAGSDYARLVLKNLLETKDATRALLLETFDTYFVSSSIKDAASELYCHRNTVMSRLNTLIELTGLDVRRPREAATLHVLLTTLRDPTS